MTDQTNKPIPNHDPLRDSILFRSMMQHTADAVYFKDLESRFLAISSAQARRYGLASPDDAVGKADSDFFSSEHALQALRDEQEILRSGQPMLNKEEKLTYQDGRVTWSSSSKLPLKDLNGEIIGTFGISRDITDRKLIQEQLENSNDELKRHAEAMNRDLDRARVIQEALLPHRLPEIPRLTLGYRHQPLETIGGDYFQFFPFTTDSMGVFIGDLAGHGVSAALFMTLVKFLTDRFGRTLGTRPRQFLEALNSSLLDQMPSAFITAAYGYFKFYPNGRATFTHADAGHPTPLLHRRATDTFEVLPGKGMGALGVLENFQTGITEVELYPGDRLFFYTDGITETSNEHHDLLGDEALPELIRKSTLPGLSETLNAVIAEVDAFRGARPVEDDILIIGCEIHPKTD